MDDVNLEGTLVLGVRLNVPEVGSDGFFNKRFLDRNMEVVAFKCTEEQAKGIAAWWKDNNSGNTTAIWRGPRVL